MSTEFLQILWFVLIAFLWIMFFFLEGFDFGVGMLLPFFSKKDEDRRAVINTIGPHWDANEVWLITAGGATFAAFPNWYATLFSGFYLALFVILLGLILRGVAFEFRSKDAHPRWRNLWDWCIFIGSFLPPLLFGVAFANMVKGVPIDENMMYTGSLLTLLNPYGLLSGLAFVAIFLLHGANFLSLKLENELVDRARNFADKLGWLALVMISVFMISTYVYTDVYIRLGITSIIVPFAGVIAVALSKNFMAQKREGWAFVSAATTIILTSVTFFMILFPRVMVSSTNPAFSLTIYNASSTPYTLSVLTIVALIFVPIVLAYQIWSYRIFRQRVKAEPKSLTY